MSIANALARAQAPLGAAYQIGFPLMPLLRELGGAWDEQIRVRCSSFPTHPHSKYALNTYCCTIRCVLKNEPFKAMA